MVRFGCRTVYHYPLGITLVDDESKNVVVNFGCLVTYHIVMNIIISR